MFGWQRSSSTSRTSSDTMKARSGSRTRTSSASSARCTIIDKQNHPDYAIDEEALGEDQILADYRMVRMTESQWVQLRTPKLRGSRVLEADERKQTAQPMESLKCPRVIKDGYSTLVEPAVWELQDEVIVFFNGIERKADDTAIEGMDESNSECDARCHPTRSELHRH
ncbi:hypothetical protein CTRI78_v002133 [Colletotrichum trifolii]|uniref:Uncharacterized protein n=1 Tax=Colletotrichum trifolii TaxID=5466 RepID=A0A4R8RV41_COLTR|nr:hypothetical protein CTRI78_v002133 [Colletotrichum trifolii]